LAKRKSALCNLLDRGATRLPIHSISGAIGYHIIFLSINNVPNLHFQPLNVSYKVLKLKAELHLANLKVRSRQKSLLKIMLANELWLIIQKRAAGPPRALVCEHEKSCIQTCKLPSGACSCFE